MGSPLKFRWARRHLGDRGSLHKQPQLLHPGFSFSQVLLLLLLLLLIQAAAGLHALHGAPHIMLSLQQSCHFLLSYLT